VFLMSEVPSGETVSNCSHLSREIQGYLAHKKTPPPPKDHHRALGIGLLSGPRGERFLMSEVSL